MGDKGNEYSNTRHHEECLKIFIRHCDNRSECWSENFTHNHGNCTEWYDTYKAGYEQFLEYYHFQTTMCTFVFGPMILLGLVGNVISFVTWGKLTRQNSLSFLLRTLAVIDSCLLLGEVFRVLTNVITTFHVDGWLNTATDVLWPYTRAYIYPVTYMALLANILTSVCIGMNRYTVVCRPLQAARWCTVSIAQKQVICIVLFSVLALFPSFFECEIIKRTGGTLEVLCTWLDNKWYYYIYHVVCCFLVGSLTPFALISFFCVRMITTLRAARRQPIDRHGDRLRETRVTSMVLILLGVFIVCHIYWWIYRFCVTFLSYSLYRHICFAYALSFEELLMILNSSLNCWIYFAFIKEFRRTLCNKKCHRSETNQAYEMS